MQIIYINIDDSGKLVNSEKVSIYADLEVNVCYQKSDKSYLIQASDLIAGTVRKLYLNNLENVLEFIKRIDFVNYRIFLP